MRLVLAMTPHDKDYVDAYYGPPQWRSEVAANPRPLEAIRAEADSLVAALGGLPAGAGNAGNRGRMPSRSLVERLGPTQVRRLYLAQQLGALSARCGILLGGRLTFDAESRALYGAVAPSVPDSTFERAIGRLHALLPGTGPLPERFDTFRKQFEIPKEKIDTLMTVAIRECRERTRRHIALPASERFTIEYVTGKSWGAYNWYKGDYRSVIQVNLDTPIYIHGPVGLACHEGYPGHHVYNVLHEEKLVRGRGWIEFTVYPLFTPESFIAEGSAELGVDITFPGRDRLEFEKRVLYPLAGLDTTQAERYFEVRQVLRQLRYSGFQAARRYLDGRMSAAETAAWLCTHALLTPEEAEEGIQFMDQYRSYVVNYALGTDVLLRRLESRGAMPEGSEQSWREFVKIISSPSIVSAL